MEFWLPYGKTEVPIAVPDENLLGFLAPSEPPSKQNLDDALTETLQHSVHGQSLLDVAEASRKIVIAFSSKSSASVSLSCLLTRELSGKATGELTLLEGAPDPTQPVASCAAPTQILDPAVRRIMHDRKDSEVVKVGQLEGGVEVLLSKAFMDADFRCVITNVAINAFWGYSGGPSLIVPGLASESTVKTCLSTTAKGERQPGVLAGNPTYETISRVSQMIQVDLGVHLLEAPDGTIAGFFLGDFAETFQQACSAAEKMFRPQLQKRADIVISSAGGAPWDSTLFGVSPCAITAATACKDSGIVVMVAECVDGAGEFSAKSGVRDPKAQTGSVRKSFSLERAVEYSVERLSGKRRTYLVSTLPEHQASAHGLLAARSVGNAYQRAIRHAGRDATVALISHGCLVAPLLSLN